MLGKGTRPLSGTKPEHIIIIEAICNAQVPLKKAANALSGSLKMLVSIYNVSYEQQCLQLCPKGRETTVSSVPPPLILHFNHWRDRSRR